MLFAQSNSVQTESGLGRCERRMSNSPTDNSESVRRKRLMRLAMGLSLIGFAVSILQLAQNASPLVIALALLAAAVAVLVWQAGNPVQPGQFGTNANTSGLARRDLISNREFDALPVPVVFVDRNAIVLVANQAASAELGRIDIGSLIFLKFRNPEMRAAFQSAVTQQAPTHIELQDRLPVERWLRVDFCPVAGDGNDFNGILIMFRDIGESRKLDRMRSDFIANASHELRTPLASLSGFIDTLQGPASNDAAARKRFLTIMQEQAARMSRLIDDLLSLSRLETRSLSEEAGPLDLVATANEAIDSLQPVATESGVTIERQFAVGPLMIRGMHDEILQIVENLVENACKYGRSGKKVIVEISAKNLGIEKETVLAVHDFGPGIAPEHLPRLTERFYRATSSSAAGAKGTGLGLAIVKHIATRHRARLTIASETGKGSTFAVHFPVVAER
jgi:two-component system, OmpR family, phosphate regulon sensor histidine kinase PhoR